MLNRKFIFLLLSLLLAGIIGVLYIILPKANPLFVLAGIMLEIGATTFAFQKLYRLKNSYEQMVYLSLYIISVILLLYFFPTLSLLTLFLYVVFLSVFTYILLISVNVYLVSKKLNESLPLLQPSKVFIFLGQVLTVFFMATIIYKVSFAIVLTFAIFAVFFYILFRFSGWFILVSQIGGDTTEKEKEISVRLALFNTLLLTQASFVLIFYPFESFGRAVLLGSLTYVSINLSNNYLIHKLSRRLYAESAFILIISYIFVYLL